MPTKINWADETWSPITGCTPISEACEHCWAKRMAHRLKGRYGYPKDDPFRVTFHSDRLEQPLKWKKPKRIFVCSMADFYHHNVRSEWRNEVYRKVLKRPEHIFLFLTKRPENIGYSSIDYEWCVNRNWPDNLWLGVTAENQKRADERIPILLQVPAAVRFVSLEPLLSHVDIKPYLKTEYCLKCKQDLPYIGLWKTTMATCCPNSFKGMRKKLDWIIVGGETGPGARPLDPNWVFPIKNQCQGAGIPFFFKQWGEWIFPDRRQYPPVKVGKKKAGRLLESREWNEFPND